MNVLFRHLSRAAMNPGSLEAGQQVDLRVDLAVAHDGSGPAIVDAANAAGVKRVFDPAKVLFFFDHTIPAPSVQARANHLKILDFCDRMGVKAYHHGEGVIHQVILEEHRLSPGSIMVGADGHVATAGAYGVIAFSVTPKQFVEVMRSGVYTTTVPGVASIEITGRISRPTTARDVAIYLLGEFGTDGLKGRAALMWGEALNEATLDERLAIANLMAETGAVTCLMVEGGEVGKVGGVREAHAAYRFDASKIAPSVALPPGERKPGAVPLSEVSGTPVTQVVIGACSAGRLSDLKAVAEVLKGRKVARGVTCVVIPGSRRIANEADRLGLSEAIRSSGAIIVNPGCGTCSGAHQGVLADGDVAVSTTTRNVAGRMGDPNARVYLASPVTAAWAAVRGELSEEEK